MKFLYSVSDHFRMTAIKIALLTYLFPTFLSRLSPNKDNSWITTGIWLKEIYKYAVLTTNCKEKKVESV